MKKCTPCINNAQSFSTPKSPKRNAKLIIFAVLALGAQHSSADLTANSIQISSRLVQSISAASSTGSVLPASALSVLTQIVDQQNTAVANKFAAFSPIFDVLNKYISELMFNLTSTTNNDADIIAEAKVRGYGACDYSVNPVLLAAGGPCEAGETARTECYHYLDLAYAVLPEAITWAQNKTSNYTQNVIEIEKIRNQVRGYIVGLIESLANSTNICLDITSNDGLAVSKAALEESRQGLINLVNSIFNAIRLYARAYHAGTADVTLISKNEYYRDLTLNGLKTDVNHNFGALKATHINSALNKTGITNAVYQIEYAQTLASFKLREALEAVFSTIRDYLIQAVLGLPDPAKDDFTPGDAAYQKTLVKWENVTREYLKSVQAIYHIDFRADGTGEKKLLAAARQTVDILYTEIDLANTKTAKVANTISRLGNLNEQALALTRKYMEISFHVLRNNKTRTTEIENQLTTLQKTGIAQMKSWVNSIYKASIILAQARSGDATNRNENTVTTVDNIMTEAISTWVNASTTLSYAEILITQTNE